MNKTTQLRFVINLPIKPVYHPFSIHFYYNFPESTRFQPTESFFKSYRFSNQGWKIAHNHFLEAQHKPSNIIMHHYSNSHSCIIQRDSCINIVL